jgi:hypothetical protein
MIAESECSRATATITPMSSMPIVIADFPKIPVPNLKTLPTSLTDAMKSSLGILVILPGVENAPKENSAADLNPSMSGRPGVSLGFSLKAFQSTLLLDEKNKESGTGTQL